MAIKFCQLLILVVAASSILTHQSNYPTLCYKQAQLNNGNIKCMVHFIQCDVGLQTKAQFTDCIKIGEQSNQNQYIELNQCLEVCCSNQIHQFSIEKLKQCEGKINNIQIISQKQNPLKLGQSTQGQNNQLKIGLGVGLGILFLALILIPVIYCMRKRKLEAKEKENIKSSAQTERNLGLPVILQLKNAQKDRSIICPACKSRDIDCLSNCGHYYHLFCAYTWLKRNPESIECKSRELKDVQIVCPSCQNELILIHLDSLKKLPKIQDYKCANCATKMVI